ncbi:MAG: hypothetical protein ABR526_03380 [Chthoniobacterales bacterium]
MDEAEIKRRLQSYRPDTEDRDDPAFEEALASLETDPALAAWFRNEQAFDATMIATFREAPVPDAVKEEILQQTRDHK